MRWEVLAVVAAVIGCDFALMVAAAPLELITNKSAERIRPDAL